MNLDAPTLKNQFLVNIFVILTIWVADSMQLQFYFDLNCIPVCERVNVWRDLFLLSCGGNKTKQKRKLDQSSSPASKLQKYQGND